MFWLLDGDAVHTGVHFKSTKMIKLPAARLLEVFLLLRLGLQFFDTLNVIMFICYRVCFFLDRNPVFTAELVAGVTPLGLLASNTQVCQRLVLLD